jgi:hypothetical protein
MPAAERRMIVASLRVTPRMLREMTRDCTAARASTPPKPGEWAMVDVVRHLVEGDRDTLLPRLRRMLAEPRPVFAVRRPQDHDQSDLATLLAVLSGLVRRSSASSAASATRTGIGKA